MFNNVKVVKHKLGYGDDQYISNAAIAKDYISNHNAKKHDKEYEVSLESADFDYKMNQQMNNVNDSRIEDIRKPMLLEAFYNDGLNKLFNNIMYTIVSEALVLDNEFIRDNKVILEAVTSNFIESRGNFKLLKQSARETNSPILDSMVKLIESTANKATDRKAKTEVNDTFEFSLESDEKKEFETSKHELNLDAISKVVKEKVYNVIKDEKQREKEVKELKDELNSTENDAPVAEASHFFEDNNNCTLFGALMEQSYKEILKESNGDIDMDRVFADTILKYTLIESINVPLIECMTLPKVRQIITDCRE